MSGWSAVAQLGGEFINSAAQFAADRYHNRTAQRNAEKMAQNSIQWRVNDAQAAGVHPLYALGASTASPGAMTAGNVKANYGQALSNLASARSDAKDKNLQRQVISGQIDGQTLDNTRKQLALEKELFEFNTMKNAVTASPRISPDGHELKKPQRTQGTLNLLGVPLKMPPHLTDAATWEDVTGEGGGLISGIGNFIEIFGYNTALRILEFNKNMGSVSQVKKMNDLIFDLKSKRK